MLGRYELRRGLGRGGAAEVWLAYDTTNGTQVALKRVRLDLSAANRATQTALFEREYHTLAQLSHPHVVRVYDYGVEDGEPYYTMELLAGTDLRERSPCGWRELCEIACDLASALALIHSRRLVHRDLTPRNVRFGVDGRVRLIDFGALVPMGACRDMVGTAPFVPPEAVNAQPLDARSDLFALGALAYYVLSGRHAYPARRFDELRDFWRTRPADLATLVPDLPPALCSLIVSMISLDPSARPASASDVIERLCAIAGLERSDDMDLGQAYLTHPKLVGRDDVLSAVREQLQAGRRGRGAVSVIDGDGGIGRSRLLERCTLEGKVIGALVLRASAADGERADYGVVQALCADALLSTPDLVLQTARAHAGWLGCALPELRERMPVNEPEVADVRQRRRSIQKALLDWLCDLAAARHVLIAVDDFDRCDEPSAAVLSALALRAERYALNLILTLPTGAEPRAPAAMQVLSGASRSITLAPLTLEDCSSLLGSVFGDAPHMATLAGRLHALCAGRPGAYMAFAQHLVDRGLLRHARGGWVLPANLDDLELPDTVRALYEQRVEALPQDARELAEALALASGVVPFRHYAMLTSHGDPGRLHAALHTLVSAGALLRGDPDYAFAQLGLQTALRDRLPPDRRRRTHRRIAAVLEREGAEPMQLAHHLLLAGEESRAADLAVAEALAFIETGRSEPSWLSHLSATLEELVGYCERSGRSPKQVYALRQLLMITAMWSDPGYALEQGRGIEAQLRTELGLGGLGDLGPEASADQVAACLQRAQARYDASPVEQRGVDPLTALQYLGRYVLYATQCASFTSNVERMRELCVLIAPFAALAPSLELVDLVARSALLSIAGSGDEGAAGLARALEKLDAPDSGVPENHRRLFRLSLLFGIGVLRVKHLDPIALRYADELETHVLHAANAWRLRKLYHLHVPDMGAARTCQEQIEIIALQLKRGLWTSAIVQEQWFLAAYGNLPGLRQAHAMITDFAEHHPAYVLQREFGRGLLQLLRGGPAAAVETLAPVIASFEAAADPYRSGLAQDFCALALIEIGRADEARAMLERRFREYPDHWRHRSASAAVLALCEAAVGMHVPALARAEAAVRAVNEEALHGAHRALTLECAARTAIAAGEIAAFQRYAGQLAEMCTGERCPSLRARHAALVKEALRRSLSLTDPELLGAVRIEQQAEQAQRIAELRQRFGNCRDLGERAERALSLLLECADLKTGFVYGVRPNSILVLLARSAHPAPRGLESLLCQHVEAIATDSDERTVAIAAQPSAGGSGLLQTACGARYQVMLLRGAAAAHPVALAALRVDGDAPRAISFELIAAIADALSEPAEVTSVA